MSVAVIVRTFSILEELAKEPSLPLKTLTERTGLPKPTVHRLLRTLQEIGYVTEDNPRGSYAIGHRFIQVFRRDPSLELKRVALPYMRSLYAQFNETVNLAIADGPSISYLEVIDTTQPLRWVVEPGSGDAIHTTALGRAILAHLDRSSIHNLLRRIAGEQGIRDVDLFLSKHLSVLTQVRERGWAWDDKETNPEVVCLAVPLLDGSQPLGSISVSVPSSRATPDYQTALVQALLEARDQFRNQFSQ